VEITELTPERAKKTRGRPSGPESTDNRSAILAAAEALFALKGYTATSVREIADEVDVNPAMIHYYFGSKHALLRQVLERAMEPLAKAIAGMRSSGQAPVEKIVHLLIQSLKEHPHLPTLVVREVMLPGGVMQEHFIEYLAPRLGGAIPYLLEKEQDNGTMCKDIDPHISTLIILSLCIFPFVVKDAAGPVLHISYEETGLQELEQHITRLLGEGFSA